MALTYSVSRLFLLVKKHTKYCKNAKIHLFWQRALQFLRLIYTVSVN